MRLRPPANETRLHEARLHQAEERVDSLSGEVARLRQAIDALEPAVVVCDAAGQVVLRNHRSLDLESSQPTGALVAAATEDALSAARTNGRTTRTMELRGPPPRSLVISASPLVVDGHHIGTIAEIDDVSERRRLEAVRRDFVANVSHELRTPIGALGLLAETLAAEDDPEITARLCSRISLEAERAGNLIADLLDLSRIEAEPASEPEPVEMASVLASAMDRVRSLAARREVTIVDESISNAASAIAAGANRRRTSPLGEVRGDFGQLVSAVSNLLENAVKYSEAGGLVRITVSIGACDVSITVEDQGIGIPARDIERIFERFYRVDRARSRETGGTGLGLAIVRHVATNHGGTVSVDSREGEGSMFTLTLPSDVDHD